MADLPSVSVVVRSYKRRESLLHILGLLRQQHYPDFEVVIVEQSGFTAEERAPLDQIVSEDPRVRVIYTHPLGPAGARNLGCAHASKAVVLFLDDDDTPVGDHWLAAHARRYRAPDVAGVSGREVYSLDERCGYRPRWLARHWCLRYDLLGTPHVYCRLDAPIECVDWLHGSNASIRRSLIEEVGGWDASFYDHEEHSFCWKLRPVLKRHGQRLVFDPHPVILRQRNVPGGLARRHEDVRTVFARWHKYYDTLIRKHRPVRYAVLRLVYVGTALFMSVRFVWKDSLSHQSLPQRLTATVHALLNWPRWLLQRR